jgi:hypothetical protein
LNYLVCYRIIFLWVALAPLNFLSLFQKHGSRGFLSRHFTDVPVPGLMYALGSDTKGAGKLWVYTVTPTSVTEAPGSPYSITNAGGMVVQSL